MSPILPTYILHPFPLLQLSLTTCWQICHNGLSLSVKNAEHQQKPFYSRLNTGCLVVVLCFVLYILTFTESGSEKVSIKSHCKYRIVTSGSSLIVLVDVMFPSQGNNVFKLVTVDQEVNIIWFSSSAQRPSHTDKVL